MNVTIARILGATVLALATNAASAHGVQWGVTIGSGGFGGVAIGIPAPVVVAPPVVVMPRPVYVAPAPVYFAPAGYGHVVVRPYPPRYGARHWHHGHRAEWGRGHPAYRY